MLREEVDRRLGLLIADRFWSFFKTMAKQYDSMLNSMIDAHLEDWARFLIECAGLPAGPVTALDTDLSATLQADRLFRIGGATPSVIHLELESTGRLGIPGELLRYNVAAWAVTELPVHSILIVLRPKANATDQTGHFEILGTDGHPYLTFHYTVIRLWEVSAASLLAAGPGLAPLSLLTNEAAADLPTAFTRFRDRLRASALPVNVQYALIGSSFVLCGLRYPRATIEEVYRNMSLNLEESDTYQMILERGYARGVPDGRIQDRQETIGELATERFGTHSQANLDALRAINDYERLRRISARILHATSWDDLLATP